MPCIPGRSSKSRIVRQILGPVSHLPEPDVRLYMLALICKLDQLADKDREEFQKTYSSGLPLFRPVSPLPGRLYLESYNMWKARMSLNFHFLKLRRKRTISLRPLEVFPEFLTSPVFKEKLNCFDILAEVTRHYFLGMNVSLLPGIDMVSAQWRVKRRLHPVIQKEQVLVGDVQKCLKRDLQQDAYCALGICWTDLYPQENLNFILGEASGVLRVAAFCFGRFEPKAYRDGEPPPPITGVDGPLLWKMIKVVTHETCHIFGLGHCFYFSCAMNESKSIQQALSQPFHLCPVCLKKLQKACGFQLSHRYQLLRDLLGELQDAFPCDQLQKAAQWYSHCLQYVNDEPFSTCL